LKPGLDGSLTKTLAGRAEDAVEEPRRPIRPFQKDSGCNRHGPDDYS
jgi:hypothetical protein